MTNIDNTGAKNRINQLLATLDNGTYRLDDNNCCALRCHNGLDCTLEYLPPDQLLVHMPVIQLPDQESVREEVLEQSLAENLALLKDTKCSLVLSPNAVTVNLASVYTIAELEPTSFQEWLVQVVSRADVLRKKIIEKWISNNSSPIHVAPTGDPSNHWFQV